MEGMHRSYITFISLEWDDSFGVPFRFACLCTVQLALTTLMSALYLKRSRVFSGLIWGAVGVQPPWSGRFKAPTDGEPPSPEKKHRSPPGYIQQICMVEFGRTTGMFFGWFWDSMLSGSTWGMIVLYLCAQLAVLYTYNCSLYWLGQSPYNNKYAYALSIVDSLYN